jgi:hypothetical protein
MDLREMTQEGTRGNCIRKSPEDEVSMISWFTLLKLHCLKIEDKSM